MWFLLKDGVYDLDPAIKNCKGSTDKKESLWEALEQSWTLISQDIQDALRGSMKHQVEAVWSQNGGIPSTRQFFQYFFACNIFKSI
jgi:hypothetical protein